MTNKSDLIAYSLSTAVTVGMAVDGSAILGAFFGAVLYVTIASDSSMKQRIVFMSASFVAGYLGSPVLETIPSGFVAFIISAGIVGVVLLFHKALDRIDIAQVIEVVKELMKWKNH